MVPPLLKYMIADTYIIADAYMIVDNAMLVTHLHHGMHVNGAGICAFCCLL